MESSSTKLTQKGYQKYVVLRACDLVYSLGVIHHSPYPERIIDQIRKHYVYKGSILKIMAYHRYPWKVFRMLLQKKGRFWELDEVIVNFTFH